VLLDSGAAFCVSWAQFGHRLRQTGAKTRQWKAAKRLKAKDEQMYCRTHNPKVAGSNPAPATT
jgi:hypothetical protein